MSGDELLLLLFRLLLLPRPLEGRVLVNVPLISVRKPQVEPPAVVELSANAELTTNTEGGRGEGDTPNFLGVAVLVLKVRDIA